MGRKSYPPPPDPVPGPSNQTGDIEEEDKVVKIQELQLALQKLQEENTILRDKLRVSEARAHALQRQYAPHTINLPDELLRLIFLRAIPPFTLLDTAYPHPHHSPYAHALATTKAIISTCVQWARVGAERLYNTIVLMHIGQLAALARTLAVQPALGTLIRSIHSHCAIFEGHLQLYARELRAIFAACPRLEHFAHCGLPPDWETETAPRLTCKMGADPDIHFKAVSDSLDLLPHGLRRLDISGGAWLMPFEDIAGEFTALEELSVVLEPYGTHNYFPRAVRIPRLTYLRVATDRPSLVTLGRIALGWETPALTHLRLDYHTAPVHVDTFLTAPTRAGLLYLHVHVCCESGSPDMLPLHILPSACPALTHLVLSPSAILPETPHPNVRHLDLWTPRVAGSSFDAAEYANSENRDSETPGSRFAKSLRRIWIDAPRAFPALNTLRTLDRALPGAPDWPRLFPPALTPAKSELIEYTFAEFKVRVGDDAIMRVDNDAWSDEDDDSSDEDYNPRSSDDGDTDIEELWSEGEGHESDLEEIYSGTKEIMSLEDVLVIWENTKEQ